MVSYTVGSSLTRVCIQDRFFSSGTVSKKLSEALIGQKDTLHIIRKLHPQRIRKQKERCTEGGGHAKRGGYLSAREWND